MEKRGYIESCQEYLNSETDFLQTYGKIISFQTNDTYPPTKVELQNGKEYYMDFQCETEKAVFEIRVFHIFTDEWSYRYDVNKETIIWK